MTDLPTRLWRVCFSEGFGWPEPYKREQSARTYATGQAARRMVDTILALPSHHDLVGVWATPCEWEPVDPESLPVPVTVESEVS